MFAVCEILFDGCYEEVVIAVGTGTLPDVHDDEKIFFYVDSLEDLESLKTEGVEDFQITTVKGVYNELNEIFW